MMIESMAWKLIILSLVLMGSKKERGKLAISKVLSTFVHDPMISYCTKVESKKLVSVFDYIHVFEQTPYNNTLTKTWIWNSCFSIGQQGGGPDFGRSIYQPRAFTQYYRSFRQRSSVSLPRWRFGKQNGNKKLWSRITNPSFFVSQ